VYNYESVLSIESKRDFGAAYLAYWTLAFFVSPEKTCEVFEPSCYPCTRSGNLAGLKFARLQWHIKKRGRMKKWILFTEVDIENWSEA
jgi:hypothetical protein